MEIREGSGRLGALSFPFYFRPMRRGLQLSKQNPWVGSADMKQKPAGPASDMDPSAEAITAITIVRTMAYSSTARKWSSAQAEKRAGAVFGGIAISVLGGEAPMWSFFERLCCSRGSFLLLKRTSIPFAAMVL